MLSRRKINQLTGQILPIKDKAFEILQQESNPDYLVLRTIEELRNTLPLNNSASVKGIQRSVLMLILALDKLQSHPSTTSQMKELILSKSKKAPYSGERAEFGTSSNPADIGR